MSVADNSHFDEEFVAAWNTHDPDRTLDLLSEDVVWRDVSNPEPMPKAAARAYLQSWFTAFPDLYATIKNHVVTEDQVATEVTFTGTNSGPLKMGPDAPSIPPTGKRVNGRGTYFVRLRGGKGVEVNTYPDMAGIMMQLGIMPGGMGRESKAA
jgi:steroid delta-isomerase-like uncharacterized protein